MDRRRAEILRVLGIDRYVPRDGVRVAGDSPAAAHAVAVRDPFAVAPAVDGSTPALRDPPAAESGFR